MKKTLIISIDGGGIRGIIPLVVLQAIQLRLQTQLSQCVTAWYGTSTGSIISAALLIQDKSDFSTAIQNVLDIYEFRSTSSINPLGAKHPERALHKILDENFGYLTTAAMPTLFAVACQKEDHKPYIFNNNPDHNLADVLKASCAVPGIFQSIRIGGVDYIDGFMAAKNPSLLALNSHTNNENLILLSLGTGILHEVDAIENQVRETHLACEELAAKRGIHYFRFNPRLIESEDNMQDTRLKNIFALKKDTENYLKEKKTKLDDFINVLAQA